MDRLRLLLDRRRCKTKNEHGHSEPDAWAASLLPTDLLLDIFLRLEPAAVIRCAAVCKPWRRAVVGNAGVLGARLDRFLGTSLLLGVFHDDTAAACLQRTPGPFQSALPSYYGGAGAGDETPANKLMPAAASAAVPSLLWCKDEFILLRGTSVSSLCLCNPITGYLRVLPAAATAAEHSKYILLTGGSSSAADDDDDNPAVRILAVHSRRGDIDTVFDADDHETMAYQLFSTTSGGGEGAGVWGPQVEYSGDELIEESGRRRLCVWMDRRSTAVTEHCVYWLAGPTREITCVFALDVCSGRTWTTKLPLECCFPTNLPTTCILSMSGDGRLSLLRPLCGPVIQVWVLSNDDDDDDHGGSRWTRQQTLRLDVHDLLSHCPRRSGYHPRVEWPRGIYLCALCPRSRCVVVSWSAREFLVDIGSGSSSHPRVVRLMPYQRGPYSWPYEMDSSSTYISKMKKF